MSKRNAQSFIAERIEFPGKPGAIVPAYHREDDKKDPIVGIRHACPCGCGQWGWMRFEAYGFKDFWEPQPKKDDDLTKLTLTPSIGFMKDKVTGVYHWHGYLRDGVFEEC